jgi:hypothetical protein
MSGLDHLRTLSDGNLPSDDGLLGNARCAWGRGDLVSAESIVAAFVARPFDLEGDLLAVETKESAALIGDDGALFADLYGSRIGRLWRVGDKSPNAAEPAIDIAFDADMRQDRGDVSFRAEDHLSLDPAAAEQLLKASRAYIEQRRRDGRLRVRGFIVRALGDRDRCAALLSLYTLSNDNPRVACFSFAAIGIGPSGEVRTAQDKPDPREWTPRF